jgi:hypothetical protein
MDYEEWSKSVGFHALSERDLFQVANRKTFPAVCAKIDSRRLQLACAYLFSLTLYQFNEATVFVGDLKLGDDDEEDIKFYSNDSETNLGDIPRAEATGLRPLTSNSALKKSPAVESRPATRNGTRDGQSFNIPPRPMTQQSQRLHTPGYEEMLNRRAKFERIVTPAPRNTRLDALKIDSPASKSPSRMDVLKSLRQSPEAVRPSTSSGFPKHSHVSNSSELQWPQSLSASNNMPEKTEAVPLDDIAERVVKLLKERNYSTSQKVLDFLGTL